MTPRDSSSYTVEPHFVNKPQVGWVHSPGSWNGPPFPAVTWGALYSAKKSGGPRHAPRKELVTFT